MSALASVATALRRKPTLAISLGGLLAFGTCGTCGARAVVGPTLFGMPTPTLVACQLQPWLIFLPTLPTPTQVAKRQPMVGVTSAYQSGMRHAPSSGSADASCVDSTPSWVKERGRGSWQRQFSAYQSGVRHALFIGQRREQLRRFDSQLGERERKGELAASVAPRHLRLASRVSLRTGLMPRELIAPVGVYATVTSQTTQTEAAQSRQARSQMLPVRRGQGA